MSQLNMGDPNKNPPKISSSYNGPMRHGRCGVELKEIHIDDIKYFTNGREMHLELGEDDYILIKGRGRGINKKEIKYFVVEKSEKCVKYIPIEKHPNPKLIELFGTTKENEHHTRYNEEQTSIPIKSLLDKIKETEEDI